MGRRKTNRPAQIERAHRILEYLKKNTDKEHTVRQCDLRKVPDLEQYIGNKETFNDLIVNMAYAMNSDEWGMYPEEEWKIVFDEFTKRYCFEETNEELYEEENETEEEKENHRMPIRGLYYKHLFSYDEINRLIEGILFSKTVGTEEAERIIEKIERSLTTKYYLGRAKNICRVQEHSDANEQNIKINLRILQQAIEDGVMVQFYFNGYNHEHELERIKREKDLVSPYYLVANGGKYYLLACKENNIDKRMKRNMSIWRVDLMTEMEIPNRDEKYQIAGNKRTAKREVENLPMTWSEEFHYSHLNMAFDEPKRIVLRVSRIREKGDYTFLQDWFGNTFRYRRADSVKEECDIVEVNCSPFAMVNWALQYSDRVEVLEPKEVREQIEEKIAKLSEKYR